MNEAIDPQTESAGEFGPNVTTVTIGGGGGGISMAPDEFLMPDDETI
jgi:hypothetical protein